MENLMESASQLIGYGALIAMLVNVGKGVGIVKDGMAKVWVTGLNLLLVIALYVAGVYGFDLAGSDSLAGALADLGALAFVVVVQLGGSGLTHAVVRGSPVLGVSHSS